MKKALVVFGIFAVLVVLFAISCSAAVLRDQQQTLVSVPVGQNIAQPVYWASGMSDLNTSTAFTPSLEVRSALNAIVPYYTPDNNQYATGMYVTDWNGNASENEWLILRGTDIFGSANSSLNVSENFGYVHFALDLGGSSGYYSTSSLWNTSCFRLRVTDRDLDTYEYTFYKDASRNILYCDVLLAMEGVTLGKLDLYLVRPAGVTDQAISSSYLCLTNMWAYFDNSADPSLDLLYSPCGYSNAYYNYHGIGSYTDSADEKYWFDLGYANANATRGDQEYLRGYNDGVASVVDENGDPVNIRTLIFAVPDAVVHLFRSLFGWEIGGFNLLGLFKFLLALLAVCFVARLILRSLL